MRDWIDHLFQAPGMLDMGHQQRAADGNLGWGWLYYALARMMRPRQIVVIGSWRGFVPTVFARGLADNQEAGEVLFIDPSFVDNFWADADAVRRHFDDLGAARVRHVRATTREFVESEAYRELASVGVVFIDGHHSYEQTRYDFDAFEPKLAPDGVILLHDSARADVSLMYGDGAAYAYGVKYLVDDLRLRPDLTVFEFTAAPGVALVGRRVAAAGAPGARNRGLRDSAALFNLGRYAAATDALGALSESSDTDAWMLRGWALFKGGLIADARACFEQACRLGHPQAPWALEYCAEREA
jgi:predicted O-methyltransferase YrrM